MSVKYPEIKVQLTGGSGNAFAILGRVKRALKEGGVSNEEVDAFFKEATSGDYDTLLRTCTEWVEVE